MKRVRIEGPGSPAGHGDVVSPAITSLPNTSKPSDLGGAARQEAESRRGLQVRPRVEDLAPPPESQGSTYSPALGPR